jgi:hypothetical protein
MGRTVRRHGETNTLRASERREILRIAGFAPREVRHLSKREAGHLMTSLDG